MKIKGQCSPGRKEVCISVVKDMCIHGVAN